MNKIIKFLALVFSTMILNSCSVGTPVFIQNLSQNRVEFKIIYQHNLKDIKDKQVYKIIGQNGILTPKEFFKSSQFIDIQTHQINDSTIVFDIPKNSTIQIANGSNSWFVNDIKSISYNDKELSIKEVISQSSNHAKIVYKID